MKKGIGNIATLAWAAQSYLDWLYYIDHQDDDGAESAYEQYQGYKRQLMVQMLADMPHVSPHVAEDYVTGMLDGYIQAVTE
jgi:hypothetical protein